MLLIAAILFIWNPSISKASDCADAVMHGWFSHELADKVEAKSCMSGLKFSSYDPEYAVSQVQGLPYVSKVERVAERLGTYGQWFVFYYVEIDGDSAWYVVTVVDGKVVDLL